MNVKERAKEIYEAHIELAKTDGRLFRKTVLNQLMAETGCSVPAAATHYNNAKKAYEATNGAIQGLGRPAAAPGVRKMGGAKSKSKEDLVPDNECFAVMELVKSTEGGTVVGRYQSFLMQGDASETFDEKVEAWPNSQWVMIKGLGPNSGDTFKLEPGEKVIKEYQPVVAKQEETAA